MAYNLFSAQRLLKRNRYRNKPGNKFFEYDYLTIVFKSQEEQKEPSNTELRRCCR
jgi:hypothetical protein